MEALIQIRRATAAQWISANPILAQGEPGVETDTWKGKYGDGTTHWNSLGYSWSLLANGPSGAAGGSLTGTYPNPTLGLNTVGAPQIADGSVGQAELGTGAVITAKIGDGQVNGTKLADAAVVLAKLAPNSVDSSKIVDGSIALGDLAPGVLSGLQVDVADEGTTVQAAADKINFVGAGVAVAGASGVATVTISGAPASAILPGTIAEWYDPAPPAGWYACDGSVKADLAGTLGTRYGGTSGTLPKIEPTVVDQYTALISDVIASTQPGWQVNSLTGRITGNNVTLNVQVTRTGADISLANPNHSDQTIFTVKSNWTPEFQSGGGTSSQVRHYYISNAGGVFFTSGISADVYTNSDLNNGDVFILTLHFAVARGSTFPKVYKIIKSAV